MYIKKEHSRRWIIYYHLPAPTLCSAVASPQPIN